MRQQIWLARTGYGGDVRVARWNGGAWRDVGRESLEKVIAVQGTTAMRELSLAVDSKGRAWVLRLAHPQAGPELALARWDVDGWTAVPPASGPPKKPARAWSASMISNNARGLGDGPVPPRADYGATRALFTSV